MPRVEIYTKAFCPYCSRALSLLKGRGVPYDEHDVTMGGSLKAEMVERTSGRLTVPQIFIGDAHIGGCDDLVDAERTGKLDRLLSAA
jgi:glutaredoxin 3